MAEKKFEVKTYLIDFKCEACGSGFMRPTGEVKSADPILFPHICNACNVEQALFSKVYPIQVLENVEVEMEAEEP